MRPRTTVALLGVLLLALAGWRATAVPRAVTHPYIPEHQVAARITRAGDSVYIDSVRAFRYAADSTALPHYVSRRFHLDDVRAVWYVLSPFASWRGPAHAFLSFELADSTYLAVSVEARRERGEEFTPLGGALRRYELHYVIGEEADVIGLRTNVWRDPVYLYPTTATPAHARRLLESALARAARLREQPEYYHTITNNCATNLAAALADVSPRRARWSPAFLLPGFSDDYAWRRGLLRLEDRPEAVRAQYRVDPRVSMEREDFSRAIRAGP